MIGIGTLYNTVTVLAGALLGRTLGRHIPKRFGETTTRCLGLVTFYLAVTMMMRIPGGYALHVVAALLFGATLGELLRLEQGLEWVGQRLKDRFATEPDAGENRFVEGFVVASLIFCVGPMTLLGTFEDATGRTPLLLYIKGTMDGVLAIALASTYGWGVAFSAGFILVFQGALTGAGWLANATEIPPLYQQGIAATGGVMILAIGLVLLDIRRIRVANLLPAVPLVCLLLWLWPNAIG